MPARFDAATPGPVITTATDSVSYAHTCSGDDRYLIVAAAKQFSAELAAEYNGAAMTELSNAFTNNYRLQVWGMVNPPSGTHDVRVFLSSGTTYPTTVAISYTDADQITSTGTPILTDGDSLAPSLSGTLAPGDLGVTITMARDDDTTATVTSDWVTERSNDFGGTGSFNSHRMVATEQWGTDVTLDMTLSQSVPWHMAMIPLKPATPPTEYTIYAFSPATYNTPFAGTVNRTVGETDLLNTIPASFEDRMLRYSDGMATLSVTVDSGRTVGASEYTEIATDEWYIRPQEARRFLDAAGVDLSPYDFVNVLTPDAANSLAGLAGVAFYTALGWWSELDAFGVLVSIHEMAHVMEGHLRSQGYTNFPDCVSGSSGTNSIHCGESYGYPDNNDEGWYHDWYSGTIADDTGINATGWAKPTFVAYNATLPFDVDVTDTFTDIAGTTLEDHLPDVGGAWERIIRDTEQVITPAGRVRIDATGVVPPSVYRNFARGTNPDVSVAMDIVVTDASTSPELGPCARMGVYHETDFYHARLNPGGDDVQLYRFHGVLGNTLIGSAPWTRTVGQTYRLELRCEGDSIQVWLDDALAIDVTDSSITDAGYVGFRALGQATDTTGLHIDNLRAEPTFDPNAPPSATPPVITASTDSGTGGGITVWWELWRATLDNVLVEDTSAYLTGGGITLNHDRAFTTEARFNLRDVGVVVPPTDYLAIFQHQQYDDSRPDTRSQLGLFTTTVPPGIRTIERSDGTYTGLDLTSVLARYAFDDTYNIAASTNVVTAVTTLLGLAGITRHTIPASADVLANAKSFDVGVTYLDAANQLLSSIGYYHLSMSTDGRLVSGESREAQYVEPWRTITDADVMGPIDNQPTNTGIHNIVIVVNDNMIDPPLTSVRRNDDLTSPTSTVNIGPRVRPTEYRSDLATQDAVNALADRLLAEERTFYQTARVLLLPDPSALDTHQVVDLALTGKQQILSGRWRVRTVRMGFDPDSAGPEIELARVTDAIQGGLI